MVYNILFRFPDKTFSFSKTLTFTKRSKETTITEPKDEEYENKYEHITVIISF